MKRPFLYSSPVCPFAFRAKMALCQMQKPFDLEEIDLKNKPQKFLLQSPDGTVPLLILEDRVISESIDIVSYAFNRPLDANMHHLNSAFLPLFRKARQKEPIRQEILPLLKNFEPYLSLLDAKCLFFSFFKRLETLSPDLFIDCPFLKEWLDSIETEPLFAPIMNRFRIGQILTIHAFSPSLEERIEQKLKNHLPLDSLKIINESGNHGFKHGLESHFKVQLVSPSLTPLSPVERHRKIHAILSEELKDIHALSIEVT